MRLMLGVLIGFLASTGRLRAQSPETTSCPDRDGPSMESLLQGPEPVFTDPFSTRTVYRRILTLRLADSLAQDRVCAFLRKYDLLLLPGRFGIGMMRVLTVRRASSLEEFEHWRNTIAQAPEVRAIGFVAPSTPLARPLSAGP